jgi:hypothetical protein
MTAQQLTAIIDCNLSERKSFKNVLDLSKCRVNPRLEDFYSSIGDTRPEKLWLVLEEHPDTHSGYSIVYDESMAAFGLATPGENGKRIAIGFHGSFCDALEAM